MITAILTETSAAAVILIPVFLLLWKVKFRDFRKTALYAVFAIYLSAVYFLVGMPTIQFHTFDLNLNLIPFIGMIADLKNEIRNVFLFIPLGLFLPLLWKKYRKWKNTLLFGFGMTLSIELLQLFTYRATDINDILTNTLGTLIGYLIFKVILKKVPAVVNTVRKNDVFFIIFLVAAVMFFLQPYVVSFLYRIT